MSFGWNISDCDRAKPLSSGAGSKEGTPTPPGNRGQGVGLNSFNINNGMAVLLNEAPRCKQRGILAEFRRSQPVFVRQLTDFAEVRIAIHPRGKPRGILAKANKKWRAFIKYA